MLDQLSDDDLIALSNKDYASLSDEGLVAYANSKKSTPLAQQSTEQIVGDLAEKPWYERALAGAATPIGLGETALQMATGTPGFITGTAGKLGSLLQGKTSEEELNAAAEAATPELFHNITYDPKTTSGQLASRGLMEAFRQGGRGLAGTGAGLVGGVQAAIEGTGTSGAREKASEIYEQTAPVTQTLFEAGMLGHMGKQGYDAVSKKRATSKEEAIREKFAEQSSKLQEGFQFNPETKRLEKEGLYVDPVTGQIVNSKNGKTYGWYDKAQNKPAEAPLGLPNYAGEPLVTFPDGTTMTRAEFETQRRQTQDLEGTGTGITPSTPVMSPKDLQTRSMFDQFGKTAEEVATQRPVEAPAVEAPIRAQETPVEASVPPRPVEPAVEAPMRSEGPSPEVMQQLMAIAEQLKSEGRDLSTLTPEELQSRMQPKEAPIIDEALAEGVPAGMPDEIPLSAYEGETGGRFASEEFPLGKTMKGESPAQVRAAIDHYTKQLEQLNERIAKAENTPDFGTTDFQKLDNSRKFLENKLEQLTGTRESGRSAGVQYGETIQKGGRTKGTTEEVPSRGSVFKYEAEQMYQQLRNEGKTEAQARNAVDRAHPESGVGGKQGGAANFGFSEFLADKLTNKTSLEDVAKALGKSTNDPTVLDFYNKNYNDKITKVVTPQEAAISKIPGLKETISPELQSIDTMMERWANEGDLSGSVGIKHLRENLSSGGRMTAMRTDNSFIDWNVENILGETRKAQVKSEAAAHDIHGEVNKITGGLLSKFMGKGEGKKALVEVANELHKVEGTSKTANVRPEAQALVDKIRTSLNDLGRKIQAELESQGIEGFRFRPNYLASTFFGPYRTLVKDSSGNTIGVIAGRTKAEAQHAVEYVKEQHPDASFDLVKYDANYDGISNIGESYAKAGEVMDILKNDSEAAAQFQETMNTYYNKVQENYMGYTQHFKEKSGVFGAEGSKPWESAYQNAKDTIEAQIGVIEHGNMWLAEQKLMKDLEAINSNPDISMPNAKEYVNKYLDHAFQRTENQLKAMDSIMEGIGESMGLPPSSIKEAGMVLRNTAIANTLGLSGGFAVTQIAQVPMALTVAMGKAMSEGTHGSRSGSALMGAMDTANSIKGRRHKMSEEGKYYLDYFEKQGTTKAHIMEKGKAGDLIPTTGMGVLGKAGATTVNALAKFADAESKLVGKTIELPEIGTRRQFALTMAHYYKSAGYSLKEAAIRADKDTSTLFVDYSPQERAMMFQRMGTIGKFASTVSTFKMNNINQWATFATQPKVMYGALAALAGSSLIFTGMNGLPFGDVAESISREMKAEGWIDQTVKERMMSTVPDWAAFGPVSSLSNTAIHRKFAADNTIPDDLASFIFPLYNFYGDKFKKGKAMIDSGFAKQESAAFVRDVLPGNLKYGVDYVGLTDPKTGLTIDANQISDVSPAHYKRDKSDWATGMLLGIPTQEEYKIKQSKQLDKIAETAWKTAKSSKVKSAISALNNGDKEKFVKLAQEAVKYSPDSVQELNKYITSQAIARNMPVEKWMEMTLAQGSKTAHGTNRFKAFREMQENR